MNGKNKKILVILLCIFGFVSIVWTCTSVFNARRGGDDSQRIKHYESISEATEESARQLGDKLNNAQAGIEQAGGQIKQVSDSIERIQERADTISRRTAEIDGSTGRIEDGIRRIEKILDEAEERGSPVEDWHGSVSSGTGGGYSVQPP